MLRFPLPGRFFLLDNGRLGACWTEPLAIRNSIERGVEAAQVVGVVTLYAKVTQRLGDEAWLKVVREGKRKRHTLSQASGESSSPFSLWHFTHSSGASTFAGCRGRFENLSFGFARKKVVFCAGMTLESGYGHVSTRCNVEMKRKRGKWWVRTRIRQCLLGVDGVAASSRSSLRPGQVQVHLEGIVREAIISYWTA